MGKARSTSRQPGYPDLSRLAYAEQAVFAGNAKQLDADATFALVEVPTGKCAIITRIVGIGGSAIPGVGGTAPYYTAPTAATPVGTPDDRMNLALTYDAEVSPVGWSVTLPLLMFERNTAYYLATPDMYAPFDAKIDWTPSYPIVIPSGGALNVLQTNAIGSKVACYGYMLEEQDARAMGFDIEHSGSPSTGFRQVITTGRTAKTTAQDLVLGKTGYCIQILDIWVRIQPNIGGVATAQLKDETGNIVFEWHNDSRTQPLDIQISPGIYMTAGEKITFTGNAAADNRCTIIVNCRYVEQSEVPENCFWGFVDPARPSPTSTQIAGTAGKEQSSTITLNYAGPGTTGTTPGQGRRHVVEGYNISASKDSTATSDLVWFGITTGASGGSVGFAFGSVTHDNNLISPIVTLAAPFQTANLAVDRINVPCVANTGLIMVDVCGVAGSLIATPAGEGDIADWGITVWGRTEPTEKLATDNPQFQGTTSV